MASISDMPDNSGKQHLFALLARLWRHISSRRRLQLALLLVLMCLASLAEMASIGLVFPFLGILTEPDVVFRQPLFQTWIRFFQIKDPNQLLWPVAIGFAVAALSAGGVRLTLLWLNYRLSSAVGVDLSVDIYRRTLYQPYSFHIARNSSEVISGIFNKVNLVVANAVQPALVILSSGLIVLSILTVLLVLSPVVASIVFVGFGLMYLAIARVMRRRLAADSELVNLKSDQAVKVLQEGLGGIRDILLDGAQEVFCEVYRRADYPLRRTLADIQIIGQGPRFVIEALAMLAMAGVGLYLTGESSGINSAIPLLGAIALGAARLLPLLHLGYLNWAALGGGRAPLRSVLELLEQPLPEDAYSPLPAPIPFCRSIHLRHVSFRYAPTTAWVLENLELAIKKGERIGFIGSTGCGKSTLLDILMGLLVPTTGKLTVDGTEITAANRRAWQTRITHVPQSIFLSDLSIEENIAFGVPPEQIDHARVREAARKAQIDEAILSWPQAYSTPVGERGVKLSGGQRQRIGLARALYKNADVLVLDEATSALDESTEAEVMSSIEALGDDLTLVIVAHRLTTLKNCTRVVEVANGRVQRVGPYAEMVVQPLAGS